MHPDDWYLLRHEGQCLGVEHAALLGVRLHFRPVQQLVGLRIGPVRAVGEHGTRADGARVHGAVYTDHRIGQVVEVVGGGVEIVVGVGAFQPARHVLLADGDLDSGLAERLLHILAEPGPLLTVGQGVVHEFEAHAVGVLFVPGVIEDLVGPGHAIRHLVGPHLVGVEARRREVRAHRPGSGLAVAEPDIVDDELTVQRIGNSLANPLVVEGLVLGVEQQLRHRRDHLVALGGDGQVRVGGEPLRVIEGHRAHGREVRLALLQRRCTRRRVGDEARNDSVQVWLTLLPVVGVPVQTNVLTLLPFDELERAGAYRLIGVRVGAQVAVAENVLGDDRRLVAGESHHHVGGGFRELEHDGVIIRRLYLGHREEGVRTARVGHLGHLHDRELHVRRCEWRTVMEDHALSQLEADGLAIR